MKIILIFVLLVLSQNIWSQESADERYEDRIARIYQKFNQNEISDSEWGKIAGEKTQETYSLQTGDSLWDISEKFFGNGFYWPKVWQLNDKITNPHNIKVGNTLKFSTGNDVTPPSLDVEQNLSATQTEEDSQTEFAEGSEEVELETEEQPGVTVKSEVIIPSGRKSIPVLKKIPDSFPEWRGNPDDYDENGFAKSSGRQFNMSKPSVFVPSIINDKPWENNGVISEMEGTQTVASNYQSVIVKLKGPANPNDVFTVFENKDEVEDPDTGSDVGREIKIKGLLVIKEVLQGDSDTYKALVTKTLSPIMIDDEVIAGNHLIKASTDSSGTASNVSAKIVDGQESTRLNFVLHETVFLNRGEKDGLHVGALLDVLKNYKIRNKESKIKFDSQVIGKLKVANVGQSVATAVIVKLSAPVYPGDETSMGPVAEPSAGQSGVESTESGSQP